MTDRKYGWRPTRPDHRDRTFKLRHDVSPAVLPGRVDLRPACPAVYYQGSLGGCTANAWGGLHEFLQMKEGRRAYTPSRLFIYYNERVLEGTTGQDAGAALRDGAKVLAKLGAPDEALWPYDVARFADRPPRPAYDAAAPHTVSQYAGLDNTRLDDLRSCLADGFPFVLGVSVYDSFESDAVAKTGAVPLPSQSEGCLGGHAVLAVGYDHDARLFLVRNSWGTGWGLGGYFTIPYDYLTNPDLAADFWTARFVA